MFDSLKQSWEEIKHHEPGCRFQEHYRSRQQQRSGFLKKVLYIGGGLLIIAAGIFFLPAPGPGFLIIFVGAGLVAQESLLAARILDRTEVALRKLADFALRVWNGASTPLRVLIVVVALALAAGAAYLAYWFFFLR